MGLWMLTRRVEGEIASWDREARRARWYVGCSRPATQGVHEMHEMVGLLGFAAAESDWNSMLLVKLEGIGWEPGAAQQTS